MINRILTAIFLLSLPLAGQVLVTCIPEPPRFKNTLQLGCDIQNTGAAAVTVTAAELRRQALPHLDAPLRPTAANAQIAELNKRSFWGWAVVVIKWAGFGWSVAQGFIPEESLNDLGRMLPGGISGGLTLADAFIGRNKQDLVIPGDYLPESITLAPGESESYTLLAMPQQARAFTVSLGVAPAAAPAPMPTSFKSNGLGIHSGQNIPVSAPPEFQASSWLTLYRESQARSREVVERWRGIDFNWTIEERRWEAEQHLEMNHAESEALDLILAVNR